MNTIHHFGDSYASLLWNKTANHEVKNFVEIISNEINYKYVNQACGGESNEMILNRLINHLNNFKSGDILFINFSYFSRGCWYDITDEKIKSTNELYDELNNFKQYYFTKNKHVIDLVEYYLNNRIDYNNRVFKLIDSVLKNIQSKGVKIFYIFVEITKWSDSLIDIGTPIEFTTGFANFLRHNDFHKEEEGHYTQGIQPMLSNAILKKTNYLNIDNKNAFVDINDMNFDLKLKKPKRKKLL